jgi:pimeloyl-ACP methyl ester carboxylesterase
VSRIEIDGVGFHVRRLGVGPGHGPTVVMIHGLSADNMSSLFMTLAPPVAGFADVILYDLRGHGRSDRPPTGYGLEDSLTDLEGVLASFEVDGPVHIVGHSYGGALGLLLALRRPEAIASLVMLEGHVPLAGWGDHMAASIAYLAFNLERPDFVEWRATLTSRKGIKAINDVEALIHETSWVQDMQERTPVVEEAELRKLRLPMLSIYGEHSDVITEGRALAGWVPGARFELIEGFDHSLLMRCPDKLNALIVPWLREQGGVPEGEGPAAPAGRSAQGVGAS